MKNIHARLSKTCLLPRLPVILNFPLSINPQISIRKWPTGEFSLKLVKEGEQTNLCLQTQDKTEVLASFEIEANARFALDELYNKLLRNHMMIFFKFIGYVFIGLVALIIALIAYWIFMGFIPSEKENQSVSIETLEEQILPDIQTAFEQEKNKIQFKGQDEPNLQSYVEDINDVFAAAKK